MIINVKIFSNELPGELPGAAAPWRRYIRLDEALKLGGRFITTCRPNHVSRFKMIF